MMGVMVRVLQSAGLALAACLLAATAAADGVRVAVQKTGTLAWEFDVIRHHGLDRAANLTIATTELAAPEAGKIALRGGSVDVIVSDWLWVARERSLGAGLVFHPYSSALGAVMLPAASPIRSLSDLKRKKLAVAGGAIDKSWLLLQAALKQVGIDDVLPKLGVTGRPAMLGYVFDAAWAANNADAVQRFIDVTRKAKDILATSDAEWERIARLTGAGDAAALAAYRDRYREGIPRRPVDAEEADARTLFRVLAAQGGRDLVGNAVALDPKTFFRARSGS